MLVDLVPKLPTFCVRRWKSFGGRGGGGRSGSVLLGPSDGRGGGFAPRVGGVSVRRPNSSTGRSSVRCRRAGGAGRQRTTCPERAVHLDARSIVDGQATGSCA